VSASGAALPATVSLRPRRQPAQARSRERVERILEAARELLETHPAGSITAAAIARRAGLPIGSLYQYFPNRLAVLAELSRRSLEEIDREAIGVLHATRDRPWREAVDRVVETHLASLRRRTPATRMLRSLAASGELSELDEESNARFAEALAEHPALSGLGGARRRSRIARVAVEAAAAVESRVLQTRSPSEARALVREMKRLIQAYLAVYIEAGRDPSAAADHPR